MLALPSLSLSSLPADVLAQEEEAPSNQPDPWTDRPAPSSDVSVKVVFPDSLDKRFPIGKVVPALFGVINGGNSPVNVSFALGGLYSGYDNNFLLNKFKAEQYYLIVDAGEVKSFQYSFPAFADLDPAEQYNVALHVYYQIDASMHSTTFFNETVSFTSEPGLFNSDQIFTVFLALASLAAVVFVGYKAFKSIFGGSGSKKSRRNSEKKAAAEPTKISQNDEWLEGYGGQKKKNKNKKAD